MRATRSISRVLVTLAATGLIGHSVSGPLKARDGGLPEKTGPAKLALLVGCTEYPKNDRIATLRGPANDIPLFVELLTDPDRGYGFNAEDVRTLVGWPDVPEDRPTGENIAAAFADLIEKAEPGSQVFVVMAGHGVQVPIPEGQDPFAPNNPEDDGMDEVFLPADVGDWSGGGLGRALRDDQIGSWLDALRQKGAHVWVVFDCCHSGSMSRSAEDVEVYRSVTPEDLGIPDAAIESAVKRAKAASIGRSERSPDASPSDILQLSSKSDAPGSVAAFYAAQPWEKAPELPRPRDAPRTDDHYFGLFSYTINQCLRERKTPLSYRELGKLVVAKYRSDRGSRGPTPSLDGDLDLEVLGAKTRPAPKILFERDKQDLKLDCGGLAGITLGSILAVYPSVVVGTDDPEPVGYVEVTEVTPVSATLRPCGFGDHVVLPAASFPTQGRCEVAVRDLGDMRVKVAVAEPLGEDSPELSEMTERIRSALTQLPDDIGLLVDTEVSEEEAEWIFRAVDVASAKSHFHIDANEPRIMLFQGQGVRLPQGSCADRVAAPAITEENRERAFGNYSAADPRVLAGELARDLAKIFSWQNVWRVAGGLSGAEEARNDSGLIFEVRYSDTKNAPSKSMSNAVLRPGQVVEYHFRNDGIEDLWVAAAYMDGNYGINVFLSTAIRAGVTLKPLRAMITPDSTGVEGVVVFAVPMSKSKSRPDYFFLEQEPLGVVDVRTRDALRGDETPFELLMRAAVGKTSGAGTRGMLLFESTPAVIGHSWITTPVE